MTGDLPSVILSPAIDAIFRVLGTTYTKQFLFTRMNGAMDGFLVHCMSTTHETVCISNFKEGVADGKTHHKDDR